MTRRRIGVMTVGVIILGGAVYSGMIIRHGFSARDQPSLMEVITARTLRHLAVPSGMQNMTNPLPDTEENIREGMEHFADHCAACHANNGSGDTMYGRSMYPKPPDMRVVTQKLTDGEIYHTIQNGIRLTGMPAFGELGRSDDASTWQLVHFIRHMPQLTPEEEKAMEALNPKSPGELREEQEDNDFLNATDSSDKPKKKSTVTQYNHHQHEMKPKEKK